MDVVNIDGNKKTIIIIFISVDDNCMYFKTIRKNRVIKKKIEKIKKNKNRHSLLIFFQKKPKKIR
jgi:hypothetical protein